MAAAVVAAAALLPRAWPDRGRTSSGPSPPGPAAAATIPVVSSVTVRKIEMPPASMFFGRPSPDGRLFSFTDEEGNLAVFELATGEVHRLTSVEKESEQHAMFSAISADGRFVAYTWWALDGRYELRVIGTDGRRPRVLLRRDEVDVPHPLEWSRDGTAILTTLSRTNGTNALALVFVEDGRMQVVQELAAATRHASLPPTESASSTTHRSGRARTRGTFSSSARTAPTTRPWWRIRPSTPRRSGRRTAGVSSSPATGRAPWTSGAWP